VENLHLGVGRGLDRRRDRRIHRWRVQAGVGADAPEGTRRVKPADVGSSQEILHRAVAQVVVPDLCEVGLRVQKSGIVIPAESLALQPDHEARKVIVRVGNAGADVKSRIAQKRSRPREGVLGMGPTELYGARSAGGIHDTARETPGTRNVAGTGLALGLLVHVAGLAVGLQGRRKLEGTAPEQVVRLVRRQHRAEAASIPETTSTWILRSDLGKLGTVSE